MALDNEQKFDEFLENFRRKNKSFEDKSRRDCLLALQTHYAIKAEEGGLLNRTYYEIKERLLRNSYEFNLLVFNWDSHLHREIA